MKIITLRTGLACALAIAITAFAVAQERPSTASKSGISDASWERVGVLSSNKTWLISELDESAREYLVRIDTNAITARTRVSVIITPQKTTMCEIYYVQGFDAPFWKVVFGYDGRILSHSTGTKKEH